MSIIAYAQFTSARERAAPGTSTLQNPPGVSTYLDAVASLVPAEILTVHGAILSVTTQKAADGSIKIEDPTTLAFAFYAALLVSVIIYVFSRVHSGTWDKLDWVRMIIPPLAFVGWTMIQKATAFDAVWPSLKDAPRTVIAIFLAVLLGLLATDLAYKADQKPQQPQQQ